jgi:tRNA threonylcarbamoyladenosine biosynthesis protein TsaB
VRILAVDTTTFRGSLAVVGDDGVEAEARLSSPRGHSRWLLSAVQMALDGLGLEAAELDGFAVTVGPGSFTGLRVGMSSVQGLALAAGRPCLGVSALDVLARVSAGRASTTVALIDAVRGEVFGGVYDGAGEPTVPSRAGPVEEIIEGVEGEVAFVGDGALRYRDRIEGRVPGALFPDVELYLAAQLGRQALPELAEGKGCAPGELRPLYLRGVHIRKPRS